jgi:hypothetical protein
LYKVVKPHLKHTTTRLFTEIRWLSEGKVFNRFYEMKNELLQLFNNEDSNSDFETHLNNPLWSTKFAYLAEIFKYLNILNSNMQGKLISILTSSDKLNEFLRTINLWISHVEKKTANVSINSRC